MHHIRETTGKPTRAGCTHPTRNVCGQCFQVTYCGRDCQTTHWLTDHQYSCIGPPITRPREEEEQVIDLLQLRDLWGLIQPWLDAEDLKNLRLASRGVEQQIRRTYFSRFRVVLTQASFVQFRPELAPFITKVDDTESGGRLSLWLSRAQHNKALKDVFIDPESMDYNGIDWNSLTQIYSLEILSAGVYDTQATLPESITNLSNLRELTFGGIEDISGLTELPESIGKLSKLENLNLFRNLLSTLPESFGDLKNLRVFKAESNQFTEFPTVITQLSNLEELDLLGNQIHNIPDAISQLSNLRILEFSENQLSVIPESITQLSKLQELDLSFNPLTALPMEIGRLVTLKGLWLNETQLTALPESLYQLTNLQYLTVFDNPLTKATKDRLRRQFGNKVRF